MRSAERFKCFAQYGVMSLGQMNTWYEPCRFCLAFLSCSSAASAAAGGGAQMYTPFLYTGIHIPSELVVPPTKSCPLSNQPSGSRISALCLDESHQDLIHFSRSALLSRAPRCKGTKSPMLQPPITPSVKLPQDRPSAPCAIMRLPDTCTKWILHPAVPSNKRSRSTSSCSFIDFEVPLKKANSAVELSVNT